MIFELNFEPNLGGLGMRLVPQELPKSGQERPKSTPRAAKERPRGAWERLRAAQERQRVTKIFVLLLIFVRFRANYMLRTV